MKIEIFVMLAWIAGIQVCKDASGNIHVKLDSSTPCWNDAIERFRFKLTEAPPPRIFKGAHEGFGNRCSSIFSLRALRGLRGVNLCSVAALPSYVLFVVKFIRKAFLNQFIDDAVVKNFRRRGSGVADHRQNRLHRCGINARDCIEVLENIFVMRLR
jgi:hypothetical protein